MLLLILVVIAVLFFMFRKQNTDTSPNSTTHSKNTPIEGSNNVPKVSVTFSPPQLQTRNLDKKHNADNDYANVVFLYLHKGKWKEPRTLEYTSHLAHKTYQFDINDPLKKHADMLKNGYFCEATPEEILMTFRKAKLEDILKQHSITASGKKADLVKAIIESISIQNLKLPVMYFISDKGMKYISEHSDLISLYKNPYKITYEEYMSAKANSPSYLSYNDIIWKVFNLRELSFSATDNFSRRYNAFYRAEFLKSEGKFKDAILEYLLVAYYDIEKILESNEISPFSERIKRGLLPPETTLSSTLVDAIYELREYYQDDMPQRAIKRSNAIKKYLSAEQYSIYLRKLLATKESDLSQYL